MLFAETEDQAMIADSVGRVLAGSQGPERWTQLVALGLTAVTWPEAAGGAGAGLADLAPTLIAAGRAAAPEPLIACAVLPGLALTRAGANAPSLPDGTICMADGHALHEAGNRVSGRLASVPGANSAAHVLACLPDDRLAVLGCTGSTSCTLVDGRGAADLTFEDVSPVAIGTPTPGLAEWLRDAAATAYAADALGAMLAAREMTLAYLKQRKQFGRPLGSFQVLQHAMVDIHHETEHFHSLVLLAAHACDGADTAMRVRSVSAVKHYLGGRIRRAAASAIQLHGGIGMTEDYALGRLVKRVLVADMLHSRADVHTARLAGLIAEETRADIKEQRPT